MSLSHCVLLSLLAYLSAGEDSYLSCPGAKHDRDGNVNVYVGVLLDKPEVSTAQLLGNDGEAPPGQFYVPYVEMAGVVLRQAETINENPAILPDHNLCLQIIFVPSNHTEYNDVRSTLASPYVPLVINSLFNDSQFDIHIDYLSPLLPTALVRSPLSATPLPPHPLTLFSAFVEHNYSSNACDRKFDVVLDMLPRPATLMGGVDTVLHHFGWERFGLLVEKGSTSFSWPGDSNVFWSIYDPQDFIESFKPFNENEIRVFIYIGSLEGYLGMMLKAHEMRVDQFVWVYAHHTPLFPYQSTLDTCCNFTTEERRNIGRGLRGSLVVLPTAGYRGGVSCGVSDNVTHMEGYAADAVTLHAIASETALRRKALDEEGASYTDIAIDNTDYRLLTKQLLNTSFIGCTGRVQFSSTCSRTSDVFEVLNFVQDEEGGGGEGNHPLTRGYVVVDEGKGILRFVDDNGTMVNQSTVVFHDGTTDVPPYRPKHYYYRSKHKIL